ncbi:MAG: hypothetical protein EA403_17560 [Spirochaetaceae bacterium]|nr:MAG: hypothetical protein EA403_17560 [Spirochaetaceae bacterium]
MVCPKCGIETQVIAIIEDSHELRRILRIMVQVAGSLQLNVIREACIGNPDLTTRKLRGFVRPRSIRLHMEV